MDKIPKDMHEHVQSQIRSTHQLFSLKDSEAQGFGLPQPALNAAMFIRELSNVFKNPDHPITKWPDKFQIYQVADFNYETGEVLPINPRFVGLVSDFRDTLQARAQ